MAEYFAKQILPIFNRQRIFNHQPSPMRIMALLGGRVCDPLHINREKIEISQVFIETLGFKGRSKSGRRKGMSGTG